MIRSFIAIVIVSFVSVSSFAADFSNGAASQKECSQKIQGGVDAFPWSIALPFPWNNIQGVWQIKDGETPIYLRSKVVRSTSNRRILSLSVVTEGSCSSPVASGVGYIDALEKNVVRAIMNDGMTRYQLKIAMFDVRDLGVDTLTCGETIMAASLQEIGTMPPMTSISGGFSLMTPFVNGVENIMLKKISTDVNAICKKPGSR